MDAEGAVWVSTGGFSVARVAEGGKVLQRVELEENRAPFALMLTVTELLESARDSNDPVVLALREELR